MALPIFNEGVKFISLKVVIPFVYLESSEVALVIISNFLLNFLLFLLEVIGVTPF
jgi:hypothetical protein